MTNSIYHQLGILGSYNVSTKQVMLDFKGNVDDEHRPYFTMTHEGVHVLLGAQTEFGQITNIFYQLQKEIHFTKENMQKFISVLYESQHFVQEGFATIIPYCLLANKIGQVKAKEWAKFNITNTDRTPYHDYLEKLLFVVDFDTDKRNKFYSKISSLVMETGFRINVPKDDLLRSVDDICGYLNKEENSPDRRFEKIIELVKKDSSILDLTISEIAKKVNIPYLQANKSDVAHFMTYVLSKTPNPFDYKEEYVKEGQPDGISTLNDAFEQMVVANMNLDFEHTSEILFNLKDFIFYADVIQIVIVHVVNESIEDIAFIKSQTAENPEIALIGIIPNGEKYITYVSKQTAERLLNEQFRQATMVIRYENYDVDTFEVSWSKIVRPPELIVYSFPKQMKSIMEQIIKNNSDVKIRHSYAQFMENNPMHMLFVSIKSQYPMHIVSHMGNKGIIEVIDIIREKSSSMDRGYIESKKNTINNLLAFWMGMHWEVDWVANLYDKSKLFFRNGTVLPLDD